RRVPQILQCVRRRAEIAASAQVSNGSMLSKKGGIGWRFDLANVGLIGVSGLALAGAASTLTPPIDARNSRAGVLCRSNRSRARDRSTPTDAGRSRTA